MLEHLSTKKEGNGKEVDDVEEEKKSESRVDSRVTRGVQHRYVELLLSFYALLSSLCFGRFKFFELFGSAF